MNKLPERRMKCSECGKPFFSSRPEANAIAECIEHFGPVDEARLDVVCTNCWNEIIERMYGANTFV